MGSTIPAAKAELVELLDATNYPTSGTQVCYGEPKDFPRVAIVVGDTFGTGDNEQTWAQLGARERDERYTFGLTVRVEVPGQTQQQATEAAFATFAVIEGVFRANPTLTNLSPQPRNFALEVMGAQHIEVPTDEGFMAQIVSGVRCVARI